MRLPAILLLLAAGLTGCSGSLERLGPPPPLSTSATELLITPQWQSRLGNGAERFFIKLPPLLDAGRLYGTTLRGEVAAFDASNGKRLWRTSLETPVYAGPGDGGDLLLLGSDEAVIALNKRDGKVAWRVTLGNEVLATPVRGGDTVIARTVDGKVHAIDVPTGNIRWRFAQQLPSLTLRGISAPLIAGDRVICGFANGKVIALSLDDGSQRWETAIAQPRGRNELERIVDVDAQLTLRGDLLYAASFHGNVAALTVAGGQMIWSRDISSSTGSAAIGDDLYITDEHGDLWALSGRNGATLWKQTLLHGRHLAAPVAQGDYLVVGDYDGYLHWIAREDGRIVARVRNEEADFYWPLPSDEQPESTLREPRSIFATPVVAGDSVYAMDKRGVVGVYQVSAKKH